MVWSVSSIVWVVLVSACLRLASCLPRFVAKRYMVTSMVVSFGWLMVRAGFVCV